MPAAAINAASIQKLAPNLLGIVGERDVECRAVPLDACPVAIPGEKHAIGDAHRGENSPAGKQADLRRRQH